MSNPQFGNRNQVKPAGQDESPEPALGTDDRFSRRGGEDAGEAGRVKQPNKP